MALRKASAYTRRRVTPFTRVSKKKGKSYIKTVPQQSIVKFKMGSEKLYNEGKLPHEFTLVSSERGAIQVRHNALEACRQYINKKLDKTLVGQYLFKIIPFPHHVQRENKMLTGAGADRMQSGMQLSYGKSMGKAAILKPGKKLFFIAVQNEKAARFVRETIGRVKPKLPCKTKLVYEFNK